MKKRTMMKGAMSKGENSNRLNGCKSSVNMRIVWFIVLLILLIFLIVLFYKMGNELIEAFAFDLG